MSEGTERKSNRDVFDRLPEDCLYYISTFGSALTLLRLPTLSKTFKAFVSEFSHEIFAHGLRTCFLPMYEINWPTRPPKSQRGDISKMKWSPEKFFRKLYKCIKKEFGEKALRRDPAVITHSRGYVGQPSSIVNLFERYYCWMRAEEENFSSLQLSNCPNCAAVESTLATTVALLDFEQVDDPSDALSRRSWHPEEGAHEIEIACSGKCGFNCRVSFDILSMCQGKQHKRHVDDDDDTVQECSKAHCSNLICEGCLDRNYDSDLYFDFECQLCKIDVECERGLCDKCFERDKFGVFFPFWCERCDITVCSNCFTYCNTCGGCLCNRHGVDYEDNHPECNRCREKKKKKQEKKKK